MAQVLEANPFQPPPSLVDQYVDGLLQIPEGAEPGEVAEVREQARPAAEYGVRRMLVIDRVAQMESLTATREDVEARVQEIADRNGVDPAEVRRQLGRTGRLQALATDLTEERVFEYLKSLSTIEKEDD
jgi:FKBP-type peptidyl-prolyl cis-trans isomerase (trigger factor)